MNLDRPADILFHLTKVDGEGSRLDADYLRGKVPTEFGLSLITATDAEGLGTVGVVGPTGPTGPQGPQGDPGANGSNGVVDPSTVLVDMDLGQFVFDFSSYTASFIQV